MTMIIPANPKAEYEALAQPIEQAVLRVLQSGTYLHGPETELFEEEFAQYLGVEHCLAVGSGTQALHLALLALDIGQGDEVIMASHTATATVAAVALSGANAVLVDVDADTMTISAEAAAQARTLATKAILPVHLYGHPVAIKELRAFADASSLGLVEDCAQAHGAEYMGRKVGGFGDAGCFSFYPTKNLGAFGDAGAVVFRDGALKEKAQALREYGWKEKFYSESAGMNARMDELHAAVLRVKLKNLQRSNDRRRAIAQLYDDGIRAEQVTLPVALSGTKHVYHQYVIRVGKRDELRHALEEQGIYTGVHYPYGIHQQPGYQSHVRVAGSLQNTAAILQQIVSLPMHPGLRDEEVHAVIEAVNGFYR